MLRAEAQEAGHLAAGLAISYGRPEMHLGGGEYRRAGAPLADHDRKPSGSNHSRYLESSLETSDMRELDFQQIRPILFEQRQRLLGRADAFLGGNRNTHAASQLGETLNIAARQRLLRIRDVKLL